jgi:hypothetical protein
MHPRLCGPSNHDSLRVSVLLPLKLVFCWRRFSLPSLRVPLAFSRGWVLLCFSCPALPPLSPVLCFLCSSEGVKKPDVEIGPISRRPAAGRTITPTRQNRLAGDPDGRRENASPQRSFALCCSGFRLRAQTPAKRLSFTKKGDHSAIPQDALITQGLGACGSACGLRFDPQGFR